MSLVEMLREAAELMRQRAENPTPSPWVCDERDDGSSWINVPGCDHAWAMHGFLDEARHVASCRLRGCVMRWRTSLPP